MPKNLTYDGVGFNADWVASFRTEKQFLARPEHNHLFKDKEPDNRTQALKEVYTKCREMIAPAPAAAQNTASVSTIIEESKGGE